MQIVNTIEGKGEAMNKAFRVLGVVLFVAVWAAFANAEETVMTDSGAVEETSDGSYMTDSGEVRSVSEDGSYMKDSGEMGEADADSGDLGGGGSPDQGGSLDESQGGEVEGDGAE